MTYQCVTDDSLLANFAPYTIEIPKRAWHETRGHMKSLNLKRCIVCVAILLISAPLVAAPQDTLTREQMKEFLLKANVVKSTQSRKGITNPWHLVLSDGSVTHDGSFQSIDEHKPSMQFGNGQTEINF